MHMLGVRHLSSRPYEAARILQLLDTGGTDIDELLGCLWRWILVVALAPSALHLSVAF